MIRRKAKFKSNHTKALKQRFACVQAADRHVHDVKLLEGLARGFYWQHLVDTGVMKSGSDIARAEGLHPSVPNQLMRLTLLAPEVVEYLVATPSVTLDGELPRTGLQTGRGQPRLYASLAPWPSRHRSTSRKSS